MDRGLSYCGVCWLLLVVTAVKKTIFFILLYLAVVHSVS